VLRIFRTTYAQIASRPGRVVVEAALSSPAPPPDPRASVAELSWSEWVFMVLLYAGLAVITFAAFEAAFAWLPHNYQSSGFHSVLIFSGLAIACYVLGLRHGFDVDHIAAIDNTTRKLLNDGKKPLTVGTWFSLGHSTIVAGLMVALILATEYVKSQIGAVAALGQVLGTLISGAFLVIIGLVNLVIVSEVYALFRGLRSGELDQKKLDEQMEKRGFLYRYFGRLFRVVNEPWQIYPIGVLFGLGFDTATEVAVTALIVGVATTTSFPLWAIMSLPLLFACGMVLSDTSDGLAMRLAYGWAFQAPIRKIYYNLTLTVISVLVAFVIGGIEVLQVISSEFGLQGPFWAAITGLNFETLGFAVAGLFLVAWLVAMGIYRVKGYESIGFGKPPGTGTPPPSSDPPALPSTASGGV
jgi:nickel/cobalt transporter (NiCoT) family protein